MLTENIVHRKLMAKLQKEKRQVLSEVSFMSRVIDIVELDAKARTLISYEIKLNDMRALVAQASTCLHFSERVYLVAPESAKKNSPYIRDLRAPFGLITFRQTGKRLVFKTEREAEKSENPDPALTLEVMNIFVSSRRHLK